MHHNSFLGLEREELMSDDSEAMDTQRAFPHAERLCREIKRKM